MPRKVTKRANSAATVKQLRHEISELETRLAKAKIAFESIDDFDADEAAGLLDMLLARVAKTGDRLYLTRGKHRVAALVPADEAEFLSDWEDRHDLEEARRALNEPTIPWEQVKKELGL